MKILKRNAVIVTVLLFVSVAVYLNWSYNQNAAQADVLPNTDPAASAAVSDSGEADTDSIASTESIGSEKNKSAGLYYTGDEVNVSSDSIDHSEYFAAARLNRQQARYEATETLTAVSETETASKEMIDDAVNRIMQLSEWTVLEAELENLIIAKGFKDCVVYISDKGVNVTVPAPVEGLTTASVARITEVITGKTDFSATELSIIEIK